MIIAQGLGGLSPFIRGMIVPKEDGSIEAPDNVIQTVSAAYQQYFILRGESIDRKAVYAAIEGMIGGNPPYDQDDLDAAGLGHVTNYNNFKGRAEYEKSAQAFWNLINSTEVFVKIVIPDYLFPNANEYASIIARHFSDVVKEWPDFAPNFNLLGAQLVKFGLCPVIFPHEESPMWEVVDVSKFYIPSQSLSFVTKLTNVCVDTNYTVQDLYQIYRESEEGDPWNKEALGQFLLYRANNMLSPQAVTYNNLMDWQRWIDSNSTAVIQYFNDNVSLVNMYQQEYDGKISHYIFSPEYFNNTGQPLENTWNQDFLFFVDRQYDSIEQAVLIFTASPGEWNIYSNVGVGQKMFAGILALNQLECHTVDSAKIAGTPMVKSLGTGPRSDGPIRFYPGSLTDIGATEIQQFNFGTNINQMLAVAQHVNNGLRENAINSGDDPGYVDRQQGSLAPSQSRSKDFKEFGVLKNVVAHFYNTFDKVVRTMFIRFLKIKSGQPGFEYAEEFRRRCQEDGVPEILFDTAKTGLFGLPRQFRKVYASRVAGDGSTLARIMGLESLAPIMGTFDDKEMSAFKREWVAATVGVDYVNTFARANVGDETSGGASLARTEDGLMSIGKEPLFSADNDQAAHTDEHLGSATRVVQAVAQQEMSPVDADQYMSLAIPHLTQHISFMLRSPQFYRETLNRVKQPFDQLKQWAQLNRRNALAMIEAAKKKQLENQAATQEVMDDKERKDFVARADVARADAKVASQVERAAEANENRAEVMRTKVERDAENKRLEIQLKNQATAKGREQEELLTRTPQQLASDLDNILGNTPSTVDFES